MRCAEIMNRNVKTVKATDDVFFAARLMREHRLGFLPVCDAAGHVVGVLTDRDLAMSVCAGDRQPISTEVGDVMSRPVVSCRPSQERSFAERQMRAHGVTRLVVVDDKRRVLGVLSLSDLVGHGGKRAVGRTLRDVIAIRSGPR